MIVFVLHNWHAAANGTALEALIVFKPLFGAFIRNLLRAPVVSAHGASEYRIFALVSVFHPVASDDIRFFFFGHVDMTRLIEMAASSPKFIVLKYFRHICPS